MTSEHEIVIPLENGGTLRCGPGELHMWGGSIRICDADQNEIIMWTSEEVAEDTECVLGAIFAFATLPIPEILSAANRTRVVDGCWV